MKPFWREKPLDEKETILLEKVFDAHRLAAFRQNASSEVIKLAFQTNDEDLTKAVAAGLCTLGGIHAPIVQTQGLLSDLQFMGAAGIMGMWDGNSKIPGWGNHFCKRKPDPIVDNVMLYLAIGWPELSSHIQDVTAILHGEGKKIYPNMACATAATGLIIGMPPTLTPILLLQGRTMAWAEIIYDASRTTPTKKLRPIPR